MRDITKDTRKKAVAKLAKELQNRLFGGTSNWGGACNECKQTAFKGQPSIRVTDGQNIEWWNAHITEVNEYAKSVNGEVRCENFTSWRGEVLIKARIIFPEFYA